MDPQVLAELEVLRASVQEGKLKKAREAEERRAAQDESEAKAKLLLERAPQFFQELSTHWEGMTAFEEGPCCGVEVDAFVFTIFRLNHEVWVKVEGQASNQHRLEVQQLDLESGFPEMVVHCLRRHYQEAGLVKANES